MDSLSKFYWGEAALWAGFALTAFGYLISWRLFGIDFGSAEAPLLAGVFALAAIGVRATRGERSGV
jgi:hypothetical protein